MGSRERDDSFEPFEEEGTDALRLSFGEPPAEEDPLAQFATEPAAPRPAPTVAPLIARAPARTRRTRRVRRTSRTLFALAALGAVAVISVTTLNSLSERSAPDTPLPTTVVAADPPAPRAVSREIEQAPQSPVTAGTEPLTTAAPATTKPVREVPRPATARSAPARSAPPERVAPPPRQIPPVSRERPPMQAASPPVSARDVDVVPAPVPPAVTATAAVRPTEPVPDPRNDPPAVAASPTSVATVAGLPPSPPAAAAPASPGPPAPTPPPARVATPTAAIQSVLNRYASAFSALDASTAKAVWPNVNERNLARAFESLERQEFDLGACDIKVTAPRAVASCKGTARYTPRVGNRRTRTENREWIFRLEGDGQAWSIESVDSR